MVRVYCADAFGADGTVGDVGFTYIDENQERPKFDLAYAPPFDTTWDPVLTAAKTLDA